MFSWHRLTPQSTVTPCGETQHRLSLCGITLRVNKPQQKLKLKKQITCFKHFCFIHLKKISIICVFSVKVLSKSDRWEQV